MPASYAKYPNPKPTSDMLHAQPGDFVRVTDKSSQDYEKTGMVIQRIPMQSGPPVLHIWPSDAPTKVTAANVMSKREFRAYSKQVAVIARKDYRKRDDSFYEFAHATSRDNPAPDSWVPFVFIEECTLDEDTPSNNVGGPPRFQSER